MLFNNVALYLLNNATLYLLGSWVIYLKYSFVAKRPIRFFHWTQKPVLFHRAKCTFDYNMHALKGASFRMNCRLITGWGHEPAPLCTAALCSSAH